MLPGLESLLGPKRVRSNSLSSIDSDGLSLSDLDWEPSTLSSHSAASPRTSSASLEASKHALARASATCRVRCGSLSLLILLALLSTSAFFTFHIIGAIGYELAAEYQIDIDKLGVICSGYAIGWLGAFVLSSMFTDAIGLRAATVVFNLLILASHFGYLLLDSRNSSASYRFWVLFGARVLAGMGCEGLLNVINIVIVQQYQHSFLSLAHRFVHVFVELFGGGFAFLLLPPMLNYSVRDAVYISAFVSVASLGANLFFVLCGSGSSQVLNLSDNEALHAPIGVRLAELRSVPAVVWLVVLMALFTTPVLFAWVSLGVVYMADKWHLDPDTAASGVGMVFMWRIVWPLFAPLLDRFEYRARLHCGACVLAVASYVLLALQSVSPFASLTLLGISFALIEPNTLAMVSIAVDDSVLRAANSLLQWLMHAGFGMLVCVAAYVRKWETDSACTPASMAKDGVCSQRDRDFSYFSLLFIGLSAIGCLLSLVVCAMDWRGDRTFFLSADILKIMEIDNKPLLKATGTLNVKSNLSNGASHRRLRHHDDDNEDQDGGLHGTYTGGPAASSAHAHAHTSATAAAAAHYHHAPHSSQFGADTHTHTAAPSSASAFYQSSSMSPYASPRSARTSHASSSMANSSRVPTSAAAAATAATAASAASAASAGIGTGSLAHTAVLIPRSPHISPELRRQYLGSSPRSAGASSSPLSASTSSRTRPRPAHSHSQANSGGFRSGSSARDAYDEDISNPFGALAPSVVDASQGATDTNAFRDIADPDVV